MAEMLLVRMVGGGSHRKLYRLQKDAERIGLVLPSGYQENLRYDKRYAYWLPLADVPKAASIGMTVSAKNEPDVKKAARAAIREAKQANG